LNLKIRHYDSYSRTIALRNNKSSKYTKQPIPDSLCTILEKYIRTLKNGPDITVDGPIFPGRLKDSNLSVRQAQARFEKWRRLSGISDELTIHSFRAAYATALYASTHDPLMVKQALGHDDLNTTCRYIDERTIAIREVIDEIFSF
jgi:integrase/recombinase XerD